MAQQEHELLTQLSKAASLPEAKRIVHELEKRFLYTWRAVGDNEANYGLINIGSDPGSVLISVFEAWERLFHGGGRRMRRTTDAVGKSVTKHLTPAAA